MQRAAEGLRLLALPVETYADDHVLERERCIGALRPEVQLAILVTVPENATLGKLHYLRACDVDTLGGVWFVQREPYLLCTHNAHGDIWFFAMLLLFLVLGLEELATRLPQLVGETLHGIVVEAAFAQNGCGLFGCEAFEVVLSRGDDESRHIECPGTDKTLRGVVGEIAVGPVLPAWEHHRDECLLLPPSHDVHHGFSAISVLFRIQHMIKNLE